MDNQQQFTEDETTVSATTPEQPEFSDARRISTAVLALIAACLLGYVMHVQLLSGVPGADQNPVDPYSDSDINQREVDLNSLDYGVETISDEEIELRRNQLESLNMDSGSVNQADNPVDRFSSLQELQR